jgi:magnesium transporter
MSHNEYRRNKVKNMANHPRKRSDKTGLPPGSLIHIGEKKAEKVRITFSQCAETAYEERQVDNIAECFPLKEKPFVTWISIDGIHDTKVMEALGDHFKLHPLLLEDIMNTEQRPKTEDFGNYVYVVLRAPRYDETLKKVLSEQVSIVLGENFVISLQEESSDLYGSLRNRLKNSMGRIRKMGSDFLAYALIDVIVDNYFLVLEKVGENIEDLEDQLLTDPTSKTVQKIHGLRREMIGLRKFAWPLREVINSLQRGESSLIQETTRLYLRDVYDHVSQIIDNIETLRDIISAMLDIYLSSISNRLNEVMKVLTILATIFIPLTFLAGLWGMNFKHMPELDWSFGYPFALLIMLAVAVTMIIYFRRKKWF